MNIIKNHREKLGLTQMELSEQAGLSLRTIQRLEASHQVPKGHTLQVLSEVFELDSATFQAEFLLSQQIKKADKGVIRMINLSILSFVGIPFGNLIFPIIFWRKYRYSTFVDEIGRRIVNFQIIWWLVVSVLLVTAPFLSHAFFSNTPLILYVFFVSYAVNIMVVCVTSLKIQRNNFNFLNLPFGFL